MLRKYLLPIIGLSILLVMYCVLVARGEWEFAKGTGLAAVVILVSQVLNELHGAILRHFGERYRSFVTASVFCLALMSYGFLFWSVFPIGVVALLLGTVAAVAVAVSCAKYAVKHLIS